MRALDCDAAAGAARFDSGFPASHQTRLGARGARRARVGRHRAMCRARGAALAELAGARAREAGLTVAPRGASTLVSWEVADPEAESLRLLEEGFIVRNLPGTPYVRASVGGWTA